MGQKPTSPITDAVPTAKSSPFRSEPSVSRHAITSTAEIGQQTWVQRLQILELRHSLAGSIAMALVMGRAETAIQAPHAQSVVPSAKNPAGMVCGSMISTSDEMTMSTPAQKSITQPTLNRLSHCRGAWTI